MQADRDTPVASTILVVDDDPRVAEFMRQVLAREGYRVLCEADGLAALEAVERDAPDLVLLDLVLPGADGMDVLRKLKGQERQGFLPIILLTGQGDMETRLRGLKLGADDYLTKPASPKELLARVDALLRIKRLQEQIVQTRQRYEDDSLVDSVTGLYNVRYLDQRLRDEFKRAERYNEPLTCLVIEACELAEGRARHGDPAADAWMRSAAAALRSGVREFDVVARLESERFAVLLPRTHLTAASAVVARLWQRLQALRLQAEAQAVPLRVCMGASFFPGRDVSDAAQLLVRAQEALALAVGQPADSVCLYQYAPYFFAPE